MFFGNKPAGGNKSEKLINIACNRNETIHSEIKPWACSTALNSSPVTTCFACTNTSLALITFSANRRSVYRVFDFTKGAGDQLRKKLGNLDPSYLELAADNKQGSITCIFRFSKSVYAALVMSASFLEGLRMAVELDHQPRPIKK